MGWGEGGGGGEIQVCFGLLLFAGFVRVCVRVCACVCVCVKVCKI